MNLSSYFLESPVGFPLQVAPYMFWPVLVPALSASVAVPEIGLALFRSCL